MQPREQQHEGNEDHQREEEHENASQHVVLNRPVQNGGVVTESSCLHGCAHPSKVEEQPGCDRDGRPDGGNQAQGAPCPAHGRIDRTAGTRIGRVSRRHGMVSCDVDHDQLDAGDGAVEADSVASGLVVLVVVVEEDDDWVLVTGGS